MPVSPRPRLLEPASPPGVLVGAASFSLLCLLFLFVLIPLFLPVPPFVPSPCVCLCSSLNLPVPTSLSPRVLCLSLTWQESLWSCPPPAQNMLWWYRGVYRSLQTFSDTTEMFVHWSSLGSLPGTQSSGSAPLGGRGHPSERAEGTQAHHSAADPSQRPGRSPQGLGTGRRC